MLENLGIDWKLLSFQIANFLILVFILKKVLYKPILGFLENRRKKIEDGLAKAEKFEEEWYKIKEIESEKLAEIEKKAVQILERARIDAQNKEKEILTATREKTEKIIEEARNDIRKEKDKTSQEIKKEISDFIVFAAEKILKRTFREADEKNTAKEIIDALRKEGN